MTRTQSEENYVSIERMKKDMSSVKKDMSEIKSDLKEGFERVESNQREYLGKLESGYVTNDRHERDLVLIKWFVGASLTLSGVVVTTFVVNLITKLFSL